MPTYEIFCSNLDQALDYFRHGHRSSNTKPNENHSDVWTLNELLNAAHDHWDTRRNAAYLAGYVESFGLRFRFGRFTFSDGLGVKPDKAVLGSLIRKECLSLQGDDAIVTEKGRALIAPFKRVSDQEMEAA